MYLANFQARVLLFRAKTQRVFNRRLTQMDTDKETFKTFTAETQSTLREEFLPNRETAIGQKSSPFCLSLSPDKQKNRISAPSALICG